MKQVMFAVYYGKSKYPDGIFRTRWLADKYNYMAPHVKRRIVRVSVDFPKAYAYTIVRHETKYIKN